MATFTVGSIQSKWPLLPMGVLYRQRWPFGHFYRIAYSVHIQVFLLGFLLLPESLGFQFGKQASLKVVSGHT